MFEYSGKEIVILGLGITGLSCIDFFLSKKITPKVIDNKLNLFNKNKLPKSISVHIGSLNISWIMNADLIVVSPGVSIYLPELIQAKKKGIEIIGDVELFCREISKPLIAITGSNGKSTVTTILSKIIEKSKLKVGVGGNIGNPCLNLLKKKYDLYILEISSFQLETIFNLKPTIATVLNLTPNHMDRYYGNLYKYYQTKLKIYHRAKTCVYNEEDKKTWPKDRFSKDCISYGINKGDYTLNTKSKNIEIRGKFFVNINKIRLFGEHNYLNILAVLALLERINISKKSIINVLKKYKGLPHRFQLIHSYNGIQWINDSKSTNIYSTIAAIKSINITRQLYLLLGGEGKSANFFKLKPYILFKNINLYCFGRDGKKIAKIKQDSFFYSSIKECLYSIKKKIKPKDIVLFSPACSSLDQFSNFEHRGKEFIKLVKKIMK